MGQIDEETLREVTRRLVARFDPVRIVLYGSQARGTAHAGSDVDLAVVAEPMGDRAAVMVEINRALSGLNFDRDIVVLTPEEFELERRIPGTVARSAAEGRVLYERG